MNQGESMNKKMKKIWLKALRSGKYKQGRKYLCQTVNGEDRYCCLGVLANECLDAHWVPADASWIAPSKKPHDKYLLMKNYRKVDYVIPYNFVKETGITSCQMERLAMMNDASRYSFEKIANWIEENL
jgi:hypothetical protein